MGTAVGGTLVALVVALVAYFALRGDEEVIATPTPEPSATATATATATPADTETPQPSATAEAEPSATPEPSPTVEEGRVPEAAPIESIDVQYEDGKPVVIIVAGLPNGCAEPQSQEVTLEGTVYTVTILNSVPADDDVVCTDIFRTYEIRVAIGDVLESGETYTVMVNDQETTFTAE
jgi:hypothetical protein